MGYMLPRIDSERIQKGWSWEEFAAYMGVNCATIACWMAGKEEIPASQLLRMTQLFDCSSDYLLGLCASRFPRSTATVPTRTEADDRLIHMQQAQQRITRLLQPYTTLFPQEIHRFLLELRQAVQKAAQEMR